MRWQPHPRILPRYVLRQAVAPFILVTLLLCGVIWVLQAMRLGHHLVGAGLGLGFIGQLLLCSAPSLLGFTLPYALFIGISFGCARLLSTGELEGMFAAGARTRFLAGGLLVLVAATTGTTYGLAAWVEPATTGRLTGALRHGAARAVLGGLGAGVFQKIGPSTTIHLRSRNRTTNNDITADGVFLASSQPPYRIVLARRGFLSVDRRGNLLVQLREGEMQLSHHEGSLTRVRFGTLDHRVPLTAQLDRHFAFLEQRVHHDRAPPSDRAASCLALGLLAVTIGLCATHTRRMALIAGAMLVGHEGLLWGIRTLAAGEPLVIGIELLVAGAGWAWLVRSDRSPGRAEPAHHGPRPSSSHDNANT